MILLMTGPPRTGSSALCRALSMHDKILLTDEMGIFHDYNWKPNKKYPGKLLNFLKKPARPFLYPVFKKKGISRSALEAFVENQKPCSADVLKYMIRKSSPRPLIAGDKCPSSYLLRFDDVSRRADKFIFTMRDGRAVIASQVRNWRRNFRLNRPTDHWMKPSIEGSVKLWLRDAKLVLKCFRRVRDRAIICRYEDFFDGKTDLFDSIGSFLEIDGVAREARRWFKPVHLSSWQDEIPEIDDKITTEFKSVLRDFGYEV